MSASAQKRVKFQYDDAGNQIERAVCTNCVAKNAVYKTSETITKNEMLEENEVLYYPNPVLEELYIKWGNNELKPLSTIELYSMNGQLLKTVLVKNEDIIKISFTDYPTGYYNLLLIYGEGDKKSIKIIKQ
jgi:hypothetical protein